VTLAQRYEKFFKELGAGLRSPLTIVLTGGAAAHLLGGERPTQDLDFNIQPEDPENWEEDSQTMDRLSAKHHLPLEYSEDISRWSMINLLDWREHTLPYGSYGRLTVRLLHPKYWSIGKISRGLQTDFEDLVVILKKFKLGADELIPFWAQALRSSERSSELFIARKMIEDFLRQEGRKIWGPGYDPVAALKSFKGALEKK
jgi:hypothetical protein